MTRILPFDCTIEIDSDGDYVICPPTHITIFSAPGEGFLLGPSSFMSEHEAYEEAFEYLNTIRESD